MSSILPSPRASPLATLRMVLKRTWRWCSIVYASWDCQPLSKILCLEEDITPSAHLKLTWFRNILCHGPLPSVTLGAFRLRDESAQGWSCLHCGSESAHTIGCWVTVHKTLSPEPSAQNSCFTLHKREKYNSRAPVTLEQSCGP